MSHLDPIWPYSQAYYGLEGRLYLGIHPFDNYLLWRERSARLR